jgi:hypothetical protein
LRAPNDIGHDRECADREIFVSNAVAGGRLLLRACVVKFRTTSADAEAIPGIVLRHAEGLAQARRPAP